jgi:hypothetical protein
MKAQGSHIRIFLEVKGLGVLIVLTSSALEDPRGRLVAQQCGLVTFEELELPSPLPPDEQPPVT